MLQGSEFDRALVFRPLAVKKRPFMATLLTALLADAVVTSSDKEAPLTPPSGNRTCYKANSNTLVN